MTRGKRVALWLFGGLAAIILLGMLLPTPPGPPAGQPSSTASPAAPVQTETKPDLELLEDKGQRSEFATTITGRVKNNAGKTYSYVQIVFKLYNEAGEQVGIAMANTTGLEAGNVWRFKAVGLTPDGANYKLDNISGY